MTRLRLSASLAALLIAASPAAAGSFWTNPGNWFVVRSGPHGGAWEDPGEVRPAHGQGLGRWGQAAATGINSNDNRRISTEVFTAKPTEARPDPRIVGFHATVKDIRDEDRARVRVLDGETGAVLGVQRFAYGGHATNGDRERVHITFGEVSSIVVQVVTGNGKGAKRNGNGITVVRGRTDQVQNCAPTRAAALAGEVRGGQRDGRRLDGRARR